MNKARAIAHAVEAFFAHLDDEGIALDEELVALLRVAVRRAVEAAIEPTAEEE